MLKGFFIIFILIGAIFFGGIIFLIVYVIRSSTKTLSPEESKSERLELIGDVKASLHKVEAWGKRTSLDISNSSAFTFVRGIRSSLQGRILDYDRKTIIVFKRVDRGLTTNSIIAAASSDFQFFYVIDQYKTSVYRDGKPFGEILSSGTILNPQGEAIGSYRYPSSVSISVGPFEHRTGERFFKFTLHGNDVATFFAGRRTSNMDPDILLTTDTDSPTIFRPNKVINDVEEIWLKALVILQLTYHGFSFVELGKH